MHRTGFAGLIVVAGILSIPALPAEESKNMNMKLQKCQIGATQPAHLVGDVYLAGQPSVDDLREAKRKGITSVLNLREDGEATWNEADAAKSVGLVYHHVPFRLPKSLTDEVFDNVRKILQDKKQHPILVHCGSANRVGAVWLPHRVLDHGIPYDEALAEAKAIGLRMPEYEAIAKRYIEVRESREKK